MNELHPEPMVDELLRDPIAHLLMRRDGVEEAALRRLLGEMSRRIAPRKVECAELCC